MLNFFSCTIIPGDFFCGVDYDQVFLWSLFFLLILILSKIMHKYTRFSSEVYRKFGHILSGILIITSTFYLQQLEMMTFAIAMIIGATGAKMIGFKALYSVPRYSQGNFLYGLVAYLLAYIWIPDNTELVRYGILILVVPDALAAVIGSRWGTQLPRWNKSLLGSAVFFAATLVVTALFIQTWWIVLLVAVILTVVEFFSQWGIDNLLLPLVGSGLLYYLVYV